MYHPIVAVTGDAVPPPLRLIADPVRWRLLRELAGGDLRVRELVAAVGEAQNLVSYHLRRLRSGGLVTARRSSFDGRDTYYSLNLAGCAHALAEAGAALHPGLASAGTGPAAGREARPRPACPDGRCAAAAQRRTLGARGERRHKAAAAASGGGRRAARPLPHRHQRSPAHARGRCRQRAVRLRDQPVRQGPRGVPGVRGIAAARALEPARPRRGRGHPARRVRRVRPPRHRAEHTRPFPAAGACGRRMTTGADAAPVSLWTVMRQWGRLGCIGFGGPPSHIRLLRQLVVERRGWLDAREFEDAVAVCNLLPGPASTQLTIFCAWRIRGRLGALVGGAAFIVPGLIVILALSVLFMASSPPLAVLGAGAGAGGAVPAIAISAGASLVAPSWRNRGATWRWLLYLGAGLAAAATVGEWLVIVLLGCGAAELAIRSARGDFRRSSNEDAPGPVDKLRGLAAAPLALTWLTGGAVLASVAWEAFKVGGLSFGGGFVIIPLMQTDAVSHYHCMTGAQFLNAVALGQVTPGPVVQTVAVVGLPAAGLAGGLLASAVAFAPSFLVVLLGGPRFQRIRGNQRARAFLDRAGPGAIGAILGSAITLARDLTHPWQYAVLAGALVMLLPLRRGVVLTLVSAAAIGVTIALAAGTVAP